LTILPCEGAAVRSLPSPVPLGARQPVAEFASEWEGEKAGDEECADDHEADARSVGANVSATGGEDDAGDLYQRQQRENVDGTQGAAVDKADIEAERGGSEKREAPDPADDAVRAVALGPDQVDRSEDENEEDGGEVNLDVRRKIVPMRTATRDGDEHDAEQDKRGSGERAVG